MKDSELDALLARGALSGPERERLLENVLDHVGSPRRGLGAKTAFAILLPAAAAAVVWFGGSRWRAKPQESDGAYEARGAAAQTVKVDAACTGGPLLACPRGSRLVFRGWPNARPSYLAAFADPSGGGERIWYFSSEGESPRLGPETVDRAVVVGSEHTAARYSIHVVVSTRPLSRSEITASPPNASVIASETMDLGIVP